VHPRRGRIEHVNDRVLLFRLPTGNAEGMIATRDIVQRGPLQAGKQRANLVFPSEWIPAALNEEHRLANVGQMAVAHLFRPPRRMQRIPEEDQPLQGADVTLGGDLRGDASPHRLPADEERQVATARSCGGNRLAPRLFEHRRPIGNLSAGGDIRKIKRGSRDAPISQTARRVDDEGALLSGSCTVSEDEGRERLFGGVDFQIHSRSIRSFAVSARSQ
jgi:hypothetical protein